MTWLGTAGRGSNFGISSRSFCRVRFILIHTIPPGRRTGVFLPPVPVRYHFVQPTHARCNRLGSYTISFYQAFPVIASYPYLLLRRHFIFTRRFTCLPPPPFSSHIFSAFTFSRFYLPSHMPHIPTICLTCHFSCNILHTHACASLLPAFQALFPASGRQEVSDSIPLDGRATQGRREGRRGTLELLERPNCSVPHQRLFSIQTEWTLPC